MPLTSKEKTARYRQRLKDEGKYDMMKERDMKRKQEKRKNMTSKERKKYLEKEREYKRKSRERLEDINLTPKQTMGKLMKRTEKSLPSSPRKKSRVLRKLAKKFVIENDGNCQQCPGNSLPDSTVKAVADFFCRDDISWQSPNRKDYVLIEKVPVQKRFLIMSLKECYQLFISENPTIKIGVSKFCDLRPTHVNLSNAFPHNQCSEKGNEDKCGNRFSFLDSITCNQDNDECLLRECNDCSSKCNELYSFDDLNKEDHAKWLQWITKDGHAEKVQVQGTLEDLIEELMKQLKPFCLHTLIKRKQSLHFKNEKKRASDLYAVMQVDFAENFTIIQQNEIQSAHFHHTQVTLFTACVYTGTADENIHSYTLVSDDIRHGKHQVAVFLDYLISDIKAKYTNLETMSVFSDGAASQFKQKYLFENLTFF
ncbi:uncharacterized protein LOC117119932, partial [Anneissia japonica]|uniref:uncharacterized protein LOC117119932 n=1 Tax=Anneissia japonica TaxID=1529436 RepID=UPI00142573F6